MHTPVPEAIACVECGLENRNPLFNFEGNAAAGEIVHAVAYSTDFFATDLYHFDVRVATEQPIEYSNYSSATSSSYFRS